MKNLFLILAVAVALGGCGALQQTPPVPNVIAATSHTIGALAVEVGNAQKLGYITVAQESALLDKLAEANSTLRLAENAYAQCNATPCAGSDALLRTVDQIITQVRAQLPKPQLESVQ